MTDLISGIHGLLFKRGIVPFTGAYDAIPSIVAAYGMRRLRTAYTGAILRLRRSSDNAEQDIGYVANGDLDTAAVAAFVGGGSGYIVNWYDQSGNGYTASQSTAASQPLYVASGQNGRPVARFDGVDDDLVASLSPSLETRNGSAIVTFLRNNSAGRTEIIASTGDDVTQGHGIGIVPRWTDDNAYMQVGYFGNRVIVSSSIATSAAIVSVLGGSNQAYYLNGSLMGTGTAQSATAINRTKLYVGSGRGVSSSFRYFAGDIAEIIVCNAVLSTGDRQAAEAAANSYWSVY